MSNSDSPVEPFKQAILSTTRAIAEDGELEVSFGPQADIASGRLPTPSRYMDAEEAARIRGVADQMALRARHHDSDVHSRHMPKGSNAKAIYEAAEQARIEAIGARQMEGVARNLSAALEEESRTKGYDRYQAPEDVPLGDVVGFMVRERLTGAPPPEVAQPMVEMVRSLIEQKAGSDLDALDSMCENQDAFADITRRIIADLDLAEELGDEPNSEEGDTQEESQSEQMDSQSEEQGSEEPDPDGSSVADVEMREDLSDDESDESVTIEMEQDADGDQGDQENEGQAPYRPENKGSNRPPQAYQVYTENFDEVITAEDLCETEELSRLRNQLDVQLDHLHG
ncbi:MAG: cobaltochelatase subunit CobT, partial [Alphaproteobacteria bacterium]|nr:cobaltochelatase subunit CobT [Alphaproteobacteria bacterium]